MISFLQYLLQSPSAIGDMVITVFALVTLVGAIVYARKEKGEPEEMEQRAGAWPPAPTNANSKP